MVFKCSRVLEPHVSFKPSVSPTSQLSIPQKTSFEILTPTQPLIALMTLIPSADLPIATSIAVFFQFFGGAIFLAISQSIFVTKLVNSLLIYAPSLNPQLVLAAGASGLRKVVGEGNEEVLAGALIAYNKAIVDVFYLTLAGGAIAFVAAFGMEWRNLAEKPQGGSVGKDEVVVAKE
jgi:hypothetical protein